MHGERRTAPRNSSLARAGDTGIRIRVMASGWAIQYRMLHDGRRHILKILLPGDVFGIETLFDQTTTMSVQTSTAVTYLALPPADCIAAYETSRDFCRDLIERLASEKAMLEKWLVQLGQCDAFERTVALLLSLHRRLTRCGLASGPAFSLEVTQQDLADVIGVHAIHVNRVLGKLRARNLLSINGKVITLLDAQALADLVPSATA
ncbi:MAG: Crp/Fnr family transcriptional regulator [Gemmatimonadaceae bacterium]|nr:Crp/Fnr family transcriptional regulator [Acetobacteraceae bacterium]